MKLYKDIGYGLSRLRETIVMYDGKPHEIIGHGGMPDTVLAMDIKNDVRVTIKYDAKRLDISPLKLGYVNLRGEGKAEYFCRKPMRRDWRQGMRDNNTATPNNLRAHFSRQSICRMLMNQYPSVEECLELVNDGIYSQAFSKNFCVNYQHSVWYKGLAVIGVMKDNGKIKIADGMNWVEQALQKEGDYVY